MCNENKIRAPFMTEFIALAIIPFEELLTLPIGSVLRLVNLVTLFCAFCYTKKLYYGCSDSGRVMRPLLYFYTYIICSGIWCINRTYYLDRIVTYGLYTLIIFFLQTLAPNKKERKLMLNGLLFGGTIASFMLIWDRGASLDMGFRETLVLFGRSVDPNILAFSCVVSYVINLYSFFHEKSLKKIRFLLIPINLYAILLLGSRGAFLTTVITSAFVMGGVEFRENRYLKKFLLIFAIIVGAIVLYQSLLLNANFGNRFSIDNLLGKGNLGTANRDLIWNAALYQFFKRPLIGYGNGASMYAIERVYKFYGTHNSYLLVLLEFGIVGMILWGRWFYKEFKMIIKNSQKIYVYIFGGLLVWIFFVEGFSTKIFWGLQVVFMTSYEYEEWGERGNESS